MAEIPLKNRSITWANYIRMNPDLSIHHLDEGALDASEMTSAARLDTIRLKATRFDIFGALKVAKIQGIGK